MQRDEEKRVMEEYAHQQYKARQRELDARRQKYEILANAIMDQQKKEAELRKSKELESARRQELEAECRRLQHREEARRAHAVESTRKQHKTQSQQEPYTRTLSPNEATSFASALRNAYIEQLVRQHEGEVAKTGCVHSMPHSPTQRRGDVVEKMARQLEGELAQSEYVRSMHHSRTQSLNGTEYPAYTDMSSAAQRNEQQCPELAAAIRQAYIEQIYNQRQHEQVEIEPTVNTKAAAAALKTVENAHIAERDAHQQARTKEVLASTIKQACNEKFEAQNISEAADNAKQTHEDGEAKTEDMTVKREKFAVIITNALKRVAALKSAKRVAQKLRDIMSIREDVDALAFEYNHVFHEPVLNEKGRVNYDLLAFADKVEKQMLKLDGILSGGVELVKDRRKALSNRIQDQLALIDDYKCHGDERNMGVTV
eukprot:CFRG6694T1